MKKLITMLMLTIICFSIFIVPVSATEKRGITPFWVNTVSIDASISSSGSYSAKIAAVQGTSSISATLVLYEKGFWGNYTEVSRFSETRATAATTFNSNYAMKSGKTYRLDISATITTKGVVETITDSYERKI